MGADLNRISHLSSLGGAPFVVLHQPREDHKPNSGAVSGSGFSVYCGTRTGI